MQGRDQSIIEHIYNYCKEISEELDQIGNDRTKFLESSVYTPAAMPLDVPVVQSARYGGKKRK